MKLYGVIGCYGTYWDLVGPRGNLGNFQDLKDIEKLWEYFGIKGSTPCHGPKTSLIHVLSLVILGMVNKTFDVFLGMPCANGAPSRLKYERSLCFRLLYDATSGVTVQGGRDACLGMLPNTPSPSLKLEDRRVLP